MFWWSGQYFFLFIRYLLLWLTLTGNVNIPDFASILTQKKVTCFVPGHLRKKFSKNWLVWECNLPTLFFWLKNANATFFQLNAVGNAIFLGLNTVNAAVSPVKNNFCGLFWPPLTPSSRKIFGQYFNQRWNNSKIENVEISRNVEELETLDFCFSDANFLEKNYNLQKNNGQLGARGARSTLKKNSSTIKKPE